LKHQEGVVVFQHACQKSWDAWKGLGEAGRGGMTRLEQRGVAAFAVVIFIALVIAGLF